MAYKTGDIHISDYVKIKLCSDFFRVTDVDGDYIYLIDDFNRPTGCEHQDVVSITLTSEMAHAF